MKISVLFLMVFVLVANSQKLGDNKVQAVNPFLWPYFSPRFTHPSFFYESIGGVPKNEIVLDPQPYYNYFKDANYNEVIEDYSNNEGLYLESRANNRMRPSSQQRLAPQQRFFLNLLNSNGNNGLFGWLRPPTTAPFANPYLVTITAPLTLTTAVVSSCIPLAQFAAGSTLPCVRKRRSSPKELFTYEFNLQSAPLILTPSTVEKIEPTLLPVSIDDIRKERLSFVPSSSDKDIKSSKDDEISDEAAPLNDGLSRNYRQLAGFVQTTTSTQYFFASTVIRKTINLVIPGAAGAANQQLACLPSGFQIC